MHGKKFLLSSSIMILSLFDTVTCFSSQIDAPELVSSSSEGAPTPTQTLEQDQVATLSPHQKWIAVLNGPHDDLTTQQYLEAAMCLTRDEETGLLSITDGNRLAVYAFDKYYEGAPLSQAQAPLSQHDLIVNHHAIFAYSHLCRSDQIAYDPRFLEIMRWVLDNDANPPALPVLLATECFLFLNQLEDAKRASALFVAHPEASGLHGKYPMLCATAYTLHGKKAMAQSLHASHLATNPKEYTLTSLVNASRACDANNIGLWLDVTKRILNPELYGHTHRKQDLKSEVYLEAVECYMEARDYKNALTYLNTYFSFDGNEIDPIAYLHMANCHTNLGNYQDACEYWQIVIDKKLTTVGDYYIYASFAFDKIQEYERASQLVRYTMQHFGIPNHAYLLLQSCRTLLKTKDFKEALTLARQYMAFRPSLAPDELPNSDLVQIANVYRMNRLYEESAKLLDIMSLASNRSTSTCLGAADDHLRSGNFQKASDAFLRLTPKEFESICKEKPQYVKNALMAHAGAKRQKEAQKIINKYPTHFTGLSKVSGLRLAVRTSHTSKAPRKGKGHASQSSHTAPTQDIVRDLKISYAQQLIDGIQIDIKNARQDQTESLDTLRHSILALAHQSTDLMKMIEGDVAVTEDVLAPSNGPSSSGAASSSTSDAARHMPSADPLIALQRLKTRISDLTDEFKRQKDALMHAQKKEIRKAWIESSLASPAMVWEPTLTTDTPTRQKVAKTKMKPASTSAASSAPTQFVASSSSSAASSSTVSAKTPRIEWHITASAKKEEKILMRVPGFKAKFDEFRREIASEPWGRRGHADTHASGRAKRLMGHDNVFSRRFARGERFFYSVDFAEDGRVIITILGLMKHDL